MVELQRKLYMNWLYNFATKQMWKRSLYIVTEYGLTDYGTNKQEVLNVQGLEKGVTRYGGQQGVNEISP
jgi:hypothetical protein